MALPANKYGVSDFEENILVSTVLVKVATLKQEFACSTSASMGIQYQSFLHANQSVIYILSFDREVI